MVNICLKPKATRTVNGRLLSDGARFYEVPEGLSAGAVIALIEQFHKDVFYEEQDVSIFITHFGCEVDHPLPIAAPWVMFDASSPFCCPLRSVYERDSHVGTRRGISSCIRAVANRQSGS